MSDESPVFLIECGDGIEASAVRALLEQNGISVTIQAEHAGSVLPHLQPILAPRLLVLAKDVERARALLSANPQGAEAPTGPTIDGGICAVHEAPAVASCARCGSFLCTSCRAVGEPPVCESCLEIERVPTRRNSWARTVAIVLTSLLLVMFALSLLAR